MFGASIGRGAKRIIDGMVEWLAYGGVHPNVLTAIGVTINVGCGVLFGFGEFFWAGVVLIVADLVVPVQLLGWPRAPPREASQIPENS